MHKIRKFDAHIRKATSEERDFFENKLYPFQDEVFLLIQNEQFYLSGGTCLSRFYYDHRYSEDLDFFFDGFNLTRETYEVEFREIVNRISDSFQVEITVDAEYYKRGFIRKGDLELKVEFIYENYKNVGSRRKAQGILVDSRENIATNKLTAVYDRKTVKDFIDLYFILQDVLFEQVTAWAETKIVPLDYEGVLLAFAEQPLEGIALMKKDISPADFNRFMVELIDRILDHAKRNS